MQPNHDGHLTIEAVTAAIPDVYYLHGNARIALSADNHWRAVLEQIGAVQVDEAAYQRADALRRSER